VALKPETPLSTHEATTRTLVVTVLSSTSTETQAPKLVPGGFYGLEEQLQASLVPHKCWAGVCGRWGMLGLGSGIPL